MKINSNGNPVEDFENAVKDLDKAQCALRDAVTSLVEICHGRNYQTVEGGYVARYEDLKKVNAIRSFMPVLLDMEAAVQSIVLKHKGEL